MKRTEVSARIAGGVFAVAILAAIPVLATGDAWTPSMQDIDAADNQGISLIAEDIPENENVIDDLFKYRSDIYPKQGASLPDNPREINVRFTSDNVELNADASSLEITVVGQVEEPKEGEDGKISKTMFAEVEQDEEGYWVLSFPALNLEYGVYTVSIPEGFWTVDNITTPSLSLNYHIGYKTVKEIEEGTAASSIHGANYYYTDANGNTFGYWLDWNIQDYDYYAEEPEGDYSIKNAKFCGVITKNSQIEIWPYIKVEDVKPVEVTEWWGTKEIKVRSANAETTVTRADLHHDIVNEGVETSFPLPDSYSDYHDHPLKDIYLPSTITEVNWTGKFQTSVRNFHFSSQNVPKFSLDKDADGTPIIRVPENLYKIYKEHVKQFYSQYTLVVKSEQPRTPVYVQVDEPGTLAQEIVKLIQNLEDVQWIVLSGTPNEEDLRIFRRMPYLEILDMSQVTGLKQVSGLNNLEYLTTVILPEGVEVIGTSAFENCTSLESINFPEGLTLINKYAFKECKMLKEIVLPEGIIALEDEAFCHTRGLKKAVLPTSLKSLGGNCFIESSISEINLENIEYFGGGCFAFTPNLKEVDLSSAITIDRECFIRSSLESVTFSESLKNINYAAFANNKLRSLDIPASVEFIGREAFASNLLETEVYDEWGNRTGMNVEWSLKKIIVENSPYITSWDGLAFQDTRFETIIWKPLFPYSDNKFGDDRCFENATLYVPKLTYSDYLLSDAWVGCKRIEKMNDDLDYIYLDRDFTLRSEEGLTADAVFEVGESKVVFDSWGYTPSYGHLTTQRKTDLHLGSFSMSGHMDYYDGSYWNNIPGKMGYQGATVIANSPVLPEQTTLNFSFDTDRWNFVVLPFDVKVSDIDVEDEALWVVRKYSGDDRAKMTGNTWQNLQADDILKAGVGYIFHCSMDYRDEVKFTFHPIGDCGELFNTGNMETPLESYPSEFAHNAHWNLVGNSYPAYLSLRGVNFDAPVTVWDGNTYVAYSPVDDDYAFSPFQAFFVQLQETEGGDVLTLDARARAHSSEEALVLEITPEEENPETPAEPQMLRARRAETRSLFNLVLSDGNYADRTRLVINDAASVAYEPSRDASKFMSSEIEVPQLFVMNDCQRMAIDERPLGEGVYTLGARFGHSGEYSISLNGKNIEGYRAFLTDNLTGVTTEITSVAYAFTADASTDESRFTLELRKDVITGIDDINVDGIIITTENGALTVKAPVKVEITVACADGKIVAIDRSADFRAELPAGVYVVKAGEAIRKINIR